MGLGEALGICKCELPIEAAVVLLFVLGACILLVGVLDDFPPGEDR